MEPTPYYAGVTLYGDYMDLRDLYDTIFELSDSLFIHTQKFKDCLLGLCYDIRHAYEGRRKIITIDNGSNDTTKYFGVDILFPTLLFQFKLIRFFARFSPTCCTHHANIFRLQSCIENSLKQVNSDLADSCIELLQYDDGLHKHYLTSFIDNLNVDFIEMTKKERKNNIYQIMRSMYPMSTEYLQFERRISEEAKRLNTTPDALEIEREDKPFRW